MKWELKINYEFSSITIINVCFINVFDTCKKYKRSIRIMKEYRSKETLKYDMKKLRKAILILWREIKKSLKKLIEKIW